METCDQVDVLVVGAGPKGLAPAAAMRMRNIAARRPYALPGPRCRLAAA